MKTIVDRFKQECRIIFSAIGLMPGINKAIGLDIGHASFRAVRFGSKKTLTGEIERLKDLNSDFQIQPDEKISINFHSDSIVIRRASVPVMPKDEIASALKWQLRDNVQFDIDEAKIKFDIIGEKEDETGARKIDVVAVIYKEKDIEEKVDNLRGLGLNIQAVFPSEFALAGYVRHSNVISPQDSVAIVDMGMVRTNIAIVENSKMCFSRDLAIGGNSITEAMTGVLVSDSGRIELSREDAERIKCEQGIPQDIKLLSLIRPVLERLSGQIKRSIEYYTESYKGERIKNIILAGNGARLKGFSEYLRQETGLEPVGILPETACAEGLALVIGSGLNIIPERFSAEKKTVLKKMSARMVFIIAGLLCLVSYGFLSARAVYLKSEISIIGKHWENIKDMKPVKEKIVELTTAINKISEAGAQAGAAVRAFSHIAPSYVTLDNMVITNDKPNVRISGIILKGDRLTEFMGDIEKSGLFEDVKLRFSRNAEYHSQGAIEFDIVFNAAK